MGIEVYQRIAIFGKRLAQHEKIENTLPEISEEAKAIMNAERCSIFIVDRTSNMLWSKLSDGVGKIVLGLETGIVGETVKTKLPILVNNPYEDSRFSSKIDDKSGFVTRNILAVPILNSKQEVIGVIQMLNKYSGDFTYEDEGIMNFFANYISGTLELALLIEEHKK
jgi:GAF domain-containing protein